MTFNRVFFMHIKNVLTSSAAFTSVPLSCLLIGLDALINLEFSCLCRKDNTYQSALFWLILFGPSCFAFLLMFLLLRPFKYEYELCYPEVSCHNWCYKNRFFECMCKRIRLDNNHCVKQFVQCLVPPFVWFFLVLYDGTYLACYKTDWNGKYVFDDELKIKWCKPSAGVDQHLRDQTQHFVAVSQVISYIVLIGFCGLAVIVVGFYDCWGCGKVSKHEDPHKENKSTGQDMNVAENKSTEQDTNVPEIKSTDQHMNVLKNKSTDQDMNVLELMEPLMEHDGAKNG